MSNQITKGNWKIGNNFSNVVTDKRTERPTYSESDYEREKEYYGGYIVCESIMTKEDAKLIVAAPDMLNALQELTHLHACEQEGIRSGQPTPEQWFEAVEKAGKAIQKATE